MKQVTKDEFWEYFKDKKYTTKQGMCFHSDIFIVNDEEVGYMETSSWGAPDVYQLKYGTANSEAITLIGNIIKSKL